MSGRERIPETLSSLTVPADHTAPSPPPSTPLNTGGTVDAQQAVAMRLAGAGFDAIAAKCGYETPADAEAAVHDALAAGAPRIADTDRLVDLARLDRLLVATWRQAVSGDEGAVRVALKIIERRCDLITLTDTAPAKGRTPLDELASRRSARGSGAQRSRSAEVAE